MNITILESRCTPANINYSRKILFYNQKATIYCIETRPGSGKDHVKLFKIFDKQVALPKIG